MHFENNVFNCESNILLHIMRYVLCSRGYFEAIRFYKRGGNYFMTCHCNKSLISVMSYLFSHQL